jgi:hypothetical protein
MVLDATRSTYVFARIKTRLSKDEMPACSQNNARLKALELDECPSMIHPCQTGSGEQHQTPESR